MAGGAATLAAMVAARSLGAQRGVRALIPCAENRAGVRAMRPGDVVMHYDGSTTEVVSITLKREAFEKWRTGYSSALAIILFVAVFGLANIYVKALNAVKNR